MIYFARFFLFQIGHGVAWRADDFEASDRRLFIVVDQWKNSVG